MSLTLTAIAALIHYRIFVMESLLWGKAKTNRIFGVNEEMAVANRVFAFNQGFYNLFLALAASLGIFFSLAKGSVVGDTLVLYACLSMCGAAAVLVCSQKRLWRAALIQGGAPFLAILSYFF